jgi:nicotinate-nucleotide adenylyltransferase
MDTPRRIALYGGSFNPPHHGHVLTATMVLCSGHFDEVRILPVADHAFGKDLLPMATRAAMTRDAVAHLGPRVVVDTIESALPSPSYTVRTVRHILATEPDVALTLVLGADTWRDRQRWHAWEELETLIGGRLVVFGRGGIEPPPGAPIDFTLPDLASSDIRRRVKSGEPWWWMVPEAVEQRIVAEGLYR